MLLIRLVITSLTIAAVGTFDLNTIWQLFKEKYNRTYGSAKNETMRETIFLQNIAYIETHNLIADMGLKTYWLGINEYTDWTHEEFQQYMNGLKTSGHRNENRRMGRTHTPSGDAEEVPESWDWREHGYVTAVKNQGQCGSCWAFSATGALEGQLFRKTKQLVSLSEQNLVDCSIAEGNFGCNGGLMEYAFDYIQSNDGIDTEQCYPYEETDAECRYKSSCRATGCTGRVDIPEGDEEALKDACAKVGPISVGIDANHPSFQFYRTGTYNQVTCTSVQLNHAVLVVGYGTEDSDDFWLVKNSWGTSWGMNGYARMSRNKNNQCGIASLASYPLV